MQPSARNLQIGMSGADVAAAQQALVRLGHAIADTELRDQTFGLSTAHAVGDFQRQHGLVQNAIVDAGTAHAINQAVAALPPPPGADDRTVVMGTPSTPPPPPLPIPPAATTPAATTPSSGPASVPPAAAGPAASTPTSAPPAGGPVAVPASGAGLVPAVTPPPGPASLAATELATHVDAPSTETRVGTATDTSTASAVTAVTSTPIEKLPPIETLPPIGTVGTVGTGVPGVPVQDPPPPSTGSLSGRVVLDSGLPAAGVTLKAYNIGFGGVATPLGGVTVGADGAYTLNFPTTGGQKANVEVRAVAADGSEVPLAAPTFAASGQQTLNLVAPGSVAPLAAEYQRLTADLTPHLGGADLAAAQEGDDRSDLTLLAANTGWDSRLVALAASAAQVGKAAGIDPAAVYALLRAGLPTDPDQLARVAPDAVTAALSAASTAGIVALTAAQQTAASSAFTAFARGRRLASVATGALSSHGDMLAASGVDAKSQQAFDDLYAAHADDPDTLWKQVDAAKLPVAPLQLTGKLGLLTMNNAALAANLRPLADTPAALGAALLGAGLDDPAAWTARLTALAGSDDAAIDKLVPPAYTGKDTAERLGNYAADLARKVRLAWPTELVTGLIATDRLRLGADHDAVKGDVGTFLAQGAGLGYTLGSTPVGAFVKQHGDRVFAGFSPERIAATTQAIGTLHRLYQISPDNGSLNALYAAGFSSARQVAAVPYETFVRRYGVPVGSPAVAQLIWWKARQVSSVTYSVFGAAAQLQSSPALPVVTGSATAQQDAKDALVAQYPTMAQLFGPMDFCACDDCRSVLSPAAYLVDLLHFLDPEPLIWTGDLTEWSAAHQGATYPYPTAAAFTAAGSPAPLTPYDALTARRPDLAALPLTCENTNTAMPYVDIVNEILEYAVAHGAIDAGAVHDTGAARSADLIAEPQNLLAGVYDTTLRDAVYPLALPYDLRRATVRGFLDHYRAPLWTLLDALCPTDELAPAAGQAYGRASVYLERLGLGRADTDLLGTDTPLTGWFTLYGYPDAPTAQAALTSAPTLAARLGVSYLDLVALLKTELVNPALAPYAILGRLGIDIEDVLRYKGAAGYPPFDADDQAAFAASLGDAGPWLDATWTAGGFAAAVVLDDPGATGSFSATTLRRADGAAVDPIVFVLLNYLVRLRQTLGWPLADLDRALTVFLPGTPEARTDAALGAAMRSALLGLAHLEAVRERGSTPESGRAALARIWADLTPAEYAGLFLIPGVSAADPVFDQPAGQYLCWLSGGSYLPFAFDPAQPDDAATGNVGLTHHLASVCAALKLSSADAARVLTATGLDLATAPLSMPVVSTLARHALLAETLRIGVADLITLIAVGGLDPFTRPEAGPVTDAAHDHPQAQTLAFADLADRLRTGGLTVSDVDYLVRHQFDPVGPYRDAATPPLDLVDSLATGIAAIRAAQAMPADPLAFTDDVLSRALALVLPADAAATFLGLWTGTAQTTVAVPTPSADALDPHAYATESALTLAYDAVRAAQTLTYRGVLTDAEKTRLETAYPGTLLAQLLDAVTAQQTTFFDTYLLRQTVGTTPSGFLAPADFDTLFAPAAPGLTDAQQQDRERTRRALIGGALLPYLQNLLIRQYVVATLTASAPAAGSGVPAAEESTLVEALVTDAAMLSDRAYAGRPLLEAYTSADTLGPTVTTTPTETTVQGFLRVSDSGAYRFFVTCANAGTSVELTVDGFTDPVLNDTAATPGAEVSGFITLIAGTTYGFTVHATGTGGGAVTVAVQGDHLPKGPLEQLTVYPAAGVERIRRATVLLGKVLIVAGRLGLGSAEMTYLRAHAGDFGGLDFSYLPTGSADDASDHVTVLVGELARLAAYVALRADLSAGPADLLDVLGHARRTFPAASAPATAGDDVISDLCARLAALTRRDPATVRAAVDALGVTASTTTTGDTLTVTVAAFADERGLSRTWGVLKLAATLGVSPAALGRWATPTPDATVARDVHDTVKALYDPDTWRAVVQPISDALRRQRRDALVAYLLTARGFDSVDQLYEFFLVDPGTEPVVQTSRLRLAIASVQLFIQRSLLNLEPLVSPWAIDAARWQWMKRYRVWQANREIFLWPENWLEPEFRDDKTHLFTTVEAALLAGNLGADDAEAAFMTYLRSLELLGRLDIRSIWLQEFPDPGSNTLHVLGRTHTAPYKYFYRTYAHQMWTPWQPVTGDIEGDHVVLTLWRGRPHIFWLTFAEKDNPAGRTTQTPSQLSDQPSTALAPPRVMEIQLSWTELFQGVWTPRGNSGFGKPIRTTVPTTFQPDGQFVYATIDPSDGAAWINLTGSLNVAFRVVSKVAPAQPRTSAMAPTIGSPMVVAEGPESFYSGDDYLAVFYLRQIGGTTAGQHRGYATAEILGATPDYTLVANSGAITSVTGDLPALMNPFFYQDERSTLFVQPAVTETTVEIWRNWIIGEAPRRADFTAASVARVLLRAQVAATQRVVGAGPVDPRATYTVGDPADWLTTTGTRVAYGSSLIGATGAQAAAPVAATTGTGLTGSGLAGTVGRSGGVLTHLSGLTGVEAARTALTATTVVALAETDTATTER